MHFSRLFSPQTVELQFLATNKCKFTFSDVTELFLQISTDGVQRNWGSDEAGQSVVCVESWGPKSFLLCAHLHSSCSLFNKAADGHVFLRACWRFVWPHFECVCVRLWALSHGKRLIDGWASPGCSMAATDWHSRNLALEALPKTHHTNTQAYSRHAHTSLFI